MPLTAEMPCLRLRGTRDRSLDGSRSSERYCCWDTQLGHATKTLTSGHVMKSGDWADVFGNFQAFPFVTMLERGRSSSTVKSFNIGSLIHYIWTGLRSSKMPIPSRSFQYIHQNSFASCFLSCRYHTKLSLIQADVKSMYHPQPQTRA